MVPILVALALLATVRTTGSSAAKVSYSQFLRQVEDGQVAGVTITAGGSGANRAMAVLKGGRTVRTVLPRDYRDVLAALQAKLVNVEIQENPAALNILINASPFLVLLALWVFLMRRIRDNPEPSGSPGGSF
ncbi:MAG TPA: ATP-dependent metallopeptidase FtsH/Yme1/Tma family protein [Bryobacteraceae bacterium]|nr:ATP-dependent metallopeptidase FtsH/Yme1/Tma family protein [Bryobacteraceae bacterium]